MFADPQSVTVGSALSLPRTGTGLNTGRFQTADGTAILGVEHKLGKRNRRIIRLEHSKIAADPLVAAQNLRYSMTVSILVDVPVVGYSAADQLQVVTGLTGNLAATSNANWIKFLGGES